MNDYNGVLILIHVCFVLKKEREKGRDRAWAKERDRERARANNKNQSTCDKSQKLGGAISALSIHDCWRDFSQLYPSVQMAYTCARARASVCVLSVYKQHSIKTKYFQQTFSINWMEMRMICENANEENMNIEHAFFMPVVHIRWWTYPSALITVCSRHRSNLTRANQVHPYLVEIIW